MPEPFEFGQEDAQTRTARGDACSAGHFNGLTERQPVGKRGGCRKAFRQQQDLFHRLAFGELLDGAPLVEQAGRRADDVFADGFEQEVNRLRHTGINRANRHDERARLLDDSPWPPLGVGLSVPHGGAGVEAMAHRLDVLLPGIVVQHKVAEARMPFKDQAEEILGLALVPVRRVDELHDAREGFPGQRCAREDMHPAGLTLAVKAVAQLPVGRAFLDDQPREAESPVQEQPAAQLGKGGLGAVDFARRTRRIEAALGLSGPPLLDLLFQLGGIHDGPHFVSTPAARLNR